MPRNELHRFFLRIVMPSILAITLFLLSIFLWIIPAFEKGIMEKKKEMISELTHTAWSLLEEYNKEYKEQNFSLEEAQQKAASHIERIRYGGENKDYFWIIDTYPKMIMHPYRGELKSSDLSDYVDPNGKRLFVEAIKIVERNGEGYIDYMWQWKDDSTRIVPKLSYVKGYAPWGWIIGTGIYLEDVKDEIKTIKNRLLRIALSITLIIAIIMLFVIRQSLNIENKRKDAEAKLLLSKQKYKTLVEASTEGTLMILKQRIIFSNLKFNKLAAYDSAAITEMKFEDIFNLKWDQLVSSFDDPKKSVSLEAKIKCGNGTTRDVVVSASSIQYTGETGYIIITKEISKQEQISRETEHLAQELQTSLLLMNQPILHLIRDILKCSIDLSIHEAAKLMTRKSRDVLFIHKDDEIVGVINNSDLKKRVLAEKLDLKRPVMEIMTAPVFCIRENALLYEAILQLTSKSISHLGIKDESGKINGVVSLRDISGMQQNTVSYLIKEIELSEDIEHLKKIHTRLPVLVNALVESGDKTQNITRIITSVSDAIAHRIISLAIDELGKPPCPFAFMVMGSEGRMEQTLSTDQDNAIVFDCPEPENIEKVMPYFQTLGKQVCTKLSMVGYKLCDGNIMAMNPKWTQPLQIWENYFTDWINTSDPQSILDASIFFDFRCVYGDVALINSLRYHVNHAVDSKSVFFYHLAQSIAKYKPPLSILGNIVSKNNASDKVNLDIKKILLPIVGFIRLYSLQHKLDNTNSLARIKQLYHHEFISKSIHDELVLSYNYLMQIRFRSQARSIMQNKLPDNIVDINRLTHIEITTIKKIFSEIGNLQTKINFDFKGGN